MFKRVWGPSSRPSGVIDESPGDSSREVLRIERRGRTEVKEEGGQGASERAKRGTTAGRPWRTYLANFPFTMPKHFPLSVRKPYAWTLLYPIWQVVDNFDPDRVPVTEDLMRKRF